MEPFISEVVMASSIDSGTLLTSGFAMVIWYWGVFWMICLVLTPVLVTWMLENSGLCTFTDYRVFMACDLA